MLCLEGLFALPVEFTGLPFYAHTRVLIELWTPLPPLQVKEATRSRAVAGVLQANNRRAEAPIIVKPRDMAKLLRSRSQQQQDNSAEHGSSSSVSSRSSSSGPDASSSGSQGAHEQQQPQQEEQVTRRAPPPRLSLGASPVLVLPDPEAAALDSATSPAGAEADGDMSSEAAAQKQQGASEAPQRAAMLTQPHSPFILKPRKRAPGEVGPTWIYDSLYASSGSSTQASEGAEAEAAANGVADGGNGSVQGEGQGSTEQESHQQEQQAVEQPAAQPTSPLLWGVKGVGSGAGAGGALSTPALQRPAGRSRLRRPP